MAKANVTLKTDLLETIRPVIQEIIELTNKPYLNKGDVRKLNALSQVINKTRHELLEYNAFIRTRLSNRDQTPTPPIVKEIDLTQKRLLMDEP